MFVAETMYDHAARELGVPRETLLRKNLYSANSRTFFNHDLKPPDVPLQRMWDQMMQQSEFQSRLKIVEEFNVGNRYKKRGLAALPTTFGISFTAVHLNQAG